MLNVLNTCGFGLSLLGLVLFQMISVCVSLCYKNNHHAFQMLNILSTAVTDEVPDTHRYMSQV